MISLRVNVSPKKHEFIPNSEKDILKILVSDLFIITKIANQFLV